MSDRLEDFIRRHRDELDDKIPSARIWERVNAELKKDAGVQKKTDTGRAGSWGWAWKVAAVFFFATTTWFALEKLTIGVPSEKEVAVSQEYLDFQAADQYYTSLINQKKAEIEAFQTGNSDFGEELLQDLNSLDSMYLELKKELASFQYNEKLMDAVIRNLQLRVEILNRQINLLQKIQRVKEQEETVSI